MANPDRENESELNLLEAKCKYFVKNAHVPQHDGARAYPEISHPVRNEKIFRREDWQILNTSLTSCKLQCDVLDEDNVILQQKCNALESELAAEKQNSEKKKEVIIDLRKELELYQRSFARISKMLDDFNNSK
ncbi:hypothetical protein HYPSUDRAFT_788249 [Hypholoma sublateritium FD-334 SS-4]|uniref:Uncharacterized protein n=1 Tax=Hypholoma sublateritium (strain FD-334 SS-4) TaxID=945553 RepID=A0A0D2NVN1_HYPSF|nr:hypothetical protein HYPSUDRAFT_788249 [Hypholoma sublateritium FD-334 SS-4]